MSSDSTIKNFEKTDEFRLDENVFIRKSTYFFEFIQVEKTLSKLSKENLKINSSFGLQV